MYRVRKKFWNWTLREENVLDGWFDRYQQYIRSNPVKKNPQRTVFTINGLYYVKLFTPHKLEDKIREMMLPRARQEFEAGVELETAGIPVIRYLGWGRCLTSGMLVSAAEPEAYTLWQLRREVTPKILSELARLTRQLIEKNYFHPDYHAGNILVTVDGELKLVDAYGIVRIGHYEFAQKSRMARIILGLKEFITDAQAVEFLVQAGLANSASEAAENWNEYLVLDGIRLKKDWEKRSRQIISNYGKFVTVTDGIVFRKMPDETPASLENAEINDYPAEEARKIWLDSFRFEIAGLPCRKPLAIENGTRIYWENTPCPVWSEEERHRAEKMEIL